ncbi:nitroreductase/quinone reductase family protein [Streptomyces sp. YPW6]|uniref:nitroreductase/quinone reductase family protein n=1 Tax=Streptomyces sp. YPW6 TaxID=2840373 RepID=UPI003EB7E405
MTSARNSGLRAPLPRDGWRGWLARLPVALYRVGLGPVLGRHHLLLHHTDRSSGDIRHTALKVMAYDAKRGHWLLASTPDAAWYQDLDALPLTTIQVRNRHYAVTAHLLHDDEAEKTMTGTSPQPPRAGRRLRRTPGPPGPDVAPADPGAGPSLTLVRLDAAPGQRLP